MWRTVINRITNTIWPNQTEHRTSKNVNQKREREHDEIDQQSNKRVKVSDIDLTQDNDCVKCSYLSVEISDLREERTSIQSLHQSALCAICQYLLIEPVTLDCSHSFCSMCCLKALSRTKQCPLCRHPVERTPQKASIVIKTLLGFLASMLNNDDLTERTVEEASRVRSQIVDGVKVEEQLETLFVNRNRNAQRHAPIFDESDGVWRCPHCSFEITEGCDCCYPLDWSSVVDAGDDELIAAAVENVSDNDLEVHDGLEEGSDDYESDLDQDIRHALQEAERRLSDRSRLVGRSHSIDRSNVRAIRRNRYRRNEQDEIDELDGGVHEMLRIMFDADERDVVDVSDENVELPLFIDDEVQEVAISRPSQQSYAEILNGEAQFSDHEEFSDIDDYPVHESPDRDTEVFDDEEEEEEFDQSIDEDEDDDAMDDFDAEFEM